MNLEYTYLERLNTQTNDGQAVYHSKMLTHNLCSNQPRNPKHYLYSHWLQIVRTWQMTVGFPNFCTCFQPRSNQESWMYPTNQSQKDALLVVGLNPASLCQNTSVPKAFSLSFFTHKALSLPCLSWSLVQTQVMAVDALAVTHLKTASVCSHFGCLHVFP